MLLKLVLLMAMVLPSVASADMLGVPILSTPGKSCSIKSTIAVIAKSCSTGLTSLDGYELLNTTTAYGYVHLYDVAGMPDCASTVGYVRTLPVPFGTGGGGVTHMIGKGEGFLNGLAYCVTGSDQPGQSSNAPAGVFVNLNYHQ